jgi:hypothetical protein
MQSAAESTLDVENRQSKQMKDRHNTSKQRKQTMSDSLAWLSIAGSVICIIGILCGRSEIKRLEKENKELREELVLWHTDNARLLGYFKEHPAVGQMQPADIRR